MRFVLPLVLLLGACVQGPVGENYGQCFKDQYRVDRYIKKQVEQNPEVPHHKLTQMERERFLTNWNKDGLPSGFMYDEIWKFGGGNYSKNVILIFIEDGCVWATSIFPGHQYRYWVDEI